MRHRPSIPVPTLLAGLDASVPNPRTELQARSPYELLVAVVLSAQMTDSGVNRVTGALFARYPDATALSRARVRDLERLVRSVNYYRTKARHLVAAARALVQRFGGSVPLTIAELTTLPGVGRKTANVLVSAFAPEPEGIAVDTHVLRVARRTGLSRARTPEAVERDLLRRIPRAAWGKIHHQLVLHGRYVCTARAPRCASCPLAPSCPSVHLGRTKKRPDGQRP